jgi:hypothetical protein
VTVDDLDIFRPTTNTTLSGPWRPHVRSRLAPPGLAMFDQAGVPLEADHVSRSWSEGAG